MRVDNDKKNSETTLRQITAKPLTTDVKLRPDNSMIMFNLNGTLMRGGVLLRKILNRTTQQAIDKAFDIKNETDRTPIADYLNEINVDIRQKLENYIKSQKNITNNADIILAPEKITSLIEESLVLDGNRNSLTENKQNYIAGKIAHNIYDILVKDTEMKSLVEKSFDIYDQQTTIGSQRIIMPEVTNMLNNLANLGIPIAIVSNRTQEFVNKAFDRIFDTLSLDNQKKWQNKEWYFAKIGVQRDDDGDVIQPIKPAADLLIASHNKADRYNIKNNRDPIKNVVFVGHSETFDMRAADNLQRSEYAVDNGLNVYKLLCKYDNPVKKVNDETLINSKSALKHINEVNQRLLNSFSDN